MLMIENIYKENWNHVSFGRKIQYYKYVSSVYINVTYNVIPIKIVYLIKIFKHVKKNKCKINKLEQQGNFENH